MTSLGIDRRVLWGALALSTALLIGLAIWLAWPRPLWNDSELATLRTLWLGSLPPLPPDPSNAVADDPRAAELGRKLFFDARFSANGAIACAACHIPERGFQDDRPLAIGLGVADRRTMPLLGVAYSPWFFWDGRKDSLWSQALAPLENPVEHGGDRTQYVHLLAKHYQKEYEAIFGPLPDLAHLPAHAGPVADEVVNAAWLEMSDQQRADISRAFANMGKAIAAYERQLTPAPTRFDRYVETLLADGEQKATSQLLNTDEIAGLKLFIGKAQCVNCHNGPLFTNHDFHNTGAPAPGLPEDLGRTTGVERLLADEFNCLGDFSDAAPDECTGLRFIVTNPFSQLRRFKPPSLRGAADRPPYMHAGQFASLEEVVHHYNLAPIAPVGHSELAALHLTEGEMSQLVSFLKTLSQ
jgi:cytochrome c peroxidase